MPYWAEKIGVPRTLAVEFPFGQTLGEPGNKAQQLLVLRQGLQVLLSAAEPGTIVHSEQVWSKPVSEAIQSWQPSEPSPIIKELTPKIRQLLREAREKQVEPTSP